MLDAGMGIDYLVKKMIEEFSCLPRRQVIKALRQAQALRLIEENNFEYTRMREYHDKVYQLHNVALKENHTELAKVLGKACNDIWVLWMKSIPSIEEKTKELLKVYISKKNFNCTK